MGALTALGLVPGDIKEIPESLKIGEKGLKSLLIMINYGINAD